MISHDLHFSVGIRRASGQFSDVASVSSLGFPEVIYGSLTHGVLFMTVSVVGPGRTL